MEIIKIQLIKTDISQTIMQGALGFYKNDLGTLST